MIHDDDDDDDDYSTCDAFGRPALREKHGWGVPLECPKRNADYNLLGDELFTVDIWQGIYMHMIILITIFNASHNMVETNVQWILLG